MTVFVQRAVIFILLVTMLVTPAYGATSSKEKNLGTFGAWHAYAYNEAGQTVCYMVTTKTLKSQGPKKRELPYLMITHRPIEASTDVVSYGAGTMINAKRGIKISLGKTVFDLFSVRDTAWTRDAQTDHKLVAAIKTTPVLQVTSVSDKKPPQTIKDQFDLTGAVPAYHAIGKACGLPGEVPKKGTPMKKTSSIKSRTKK
jgi:hypothetical protein